ncbi:MAG: efflux RND transporter periplasmic adaptor subunit [Polyangiales bacterium]
MKTVVRRMQGLFAAAALLTLAGCHRADAQPSTAPPPNPVVKLESPTVAPDGATLRLFGHFAFAPGASYAVRAPLSGHVKSVPVTVGQVVEKGTVLAVIESRDAALARSELAKAAVDVKASKINLERLKALLEDKAATEREVREAEAKLAQEQAELARASEAVAALGLEKGSAATYELRASGPGRIVKRNLEPGERVGPDDAKEAFLIGDTSHLVMQATAYERDILGVTKDARASITVPSIPGATFGAHVANVGEVIDPVSRTIEVRLALDDADPRLRAEMSATVEVARPSLAAVTVPVGALFLHHDDFVVLVKQGNGYARRKVVPGPSIGARVAILSGVGKEDQVVSEGALLVDSELDRVLDP